MKTVYNKIADVMRDVSPDSGLKKKIYLDAGARSNLFLFFNNTPVYNVENVVSNETNAIFIRLLRITVLLDC